MEQGANIERRKFGRRDTHVRAFAAVGRRTPVACIVLNVSERGAKIDSGGQLDGVNSLVLIVPSLGLELKCEIRHVSASGVGLRFANYRAAAALVRQAYPMPAVPLGVTVSSILSGSHGAPVSGCELRSQLFGDKPNVAEHADPVTEPVTFNRKPRLRGRRISRPATTS